MANPVTDVPGVTDPKGPSLDDVADVLARTNRGILALSREVQIVRDLILFAVVYIGAILVGLRLRLRALGV